MSIPPIPVDGKGLDWPRRVAMAVNRLNALVRGLELATMERDTDGNPVPTWLGQSYTYDGSGNRETATVTDGTDTWVATYTYSGGDLVAESGWVKQ